MKLEDVAFYRYWSDLNGKRMPLQTCWYLKLIVAVPILLVLWVVMVTHALEKPLIFIPLVIVTAWLLFPPMMLVDSRGWYGRIYHFQMHINLGFHVFSYLLFKVSVKELFAIRLLYLIIVLAVLISCVVQKSFTPAFTLILFHIFVGHLWVVMKRLA